MASSETGSNPGSPTKSKSESVGSASPTLSPTSPEVDPTVSRAKLKNQLNSLLAKPPEPRVHAEKPAAESIEEETKNDDNQEEQVETAKIDDDNDDVMQPDTEAEEPPAAANDIEDVEVESPKPAEPTTKIEDPEPSKSTQSLSAPTVPAEPNSQTDTHTKSGKKKTGFMSKLKNFFKGDKKKKGSDQSQSAEIDETASRESLNNSNTTDRPLPASTETPKSTENQLPDITTLPKSPATTAHAQQDSPASTKTPAVAERKPQESSTSTKAPTVTERAHKGKRVSISEPSTERPLSLAPKPRELSAANQTKTAQAETGKSPSSPSTQSSEQPKESDPSNNGSIEEDPKSEQTSVPHAATRMGVRLPFSSPPANMARTSKVLSKFNTSPEDLDASVNGTKPTETPENGTPPVVPPRSKLSQKPETSAASAAPPARSKTPTPAMNGSLELHTKPSTNGGPPPLPTQDTKPTSFKSQPTSPVDSIVDPSQSESMASPRRPSLMSSPKPSTKAKEKPIEQQKESENNGESENKKEEEGSTEDIKKKFMAPTPFSGITLSEIKQSKTRASASSINRGQIANSNQGIGEIAEAGGEESTDHLPEPVALDRSRASNSILNLSSSEDIERWSQDMLEWASKFYQSPSEPSTIMAYCQDGVSLVELVKALSKDDEKFPKYRKKTIVQAQKLDNLNVLMNYSREKMPGLHITAEDILNGDPKKIAVYLDAIRKQFS